MTSLELATNSQTIHPEKGAPGRADSQVEGRSTQEMVLAHTLVEDRETAGA